METLPCELDCESIKQMCAENPEVAEVILDMIRDLGELDEECVEQAH